jgi:hypothetical protein
LTHIDALAEGKRPEDWEVDEPAGQSLARVRPIRDVNARVHRLVESLVLSDALI